MNQVARNLQQEGLPVFRSLSNFVKITICIVFIGYLLSVVFESTIEMMAVTPGYLMPPHFSIWTLGTFFLIEVHFWEVLVDIVTLSLCAKLIEPLWGPIEMISFFLITNLCSVVLTTFSYLFLYMCTKNSEVLFDVRIYGLVGYVAGVSVAVQQIMPDHPVVNTPLGNFTNRNIPLTVLFFAVIFWLVGLVEGPYPLMFCNGIIVSWVYLRFWQHHTNERRGDSSDSFQFERFFPTVLQPLVKIVVNLLYIIGLRIGVRSAKKQQEPLLPTTTTSSSRTSLDISDLDYVDVERRRQIALKALNERLSSQKTKHQQQHGSKASHSGAKVSTSPTPSSSIQAPLTSTIVSSSSSSLGSTAGLTGVNIPNMPPSTSSAP